MTTMRRILISLYCLALFNGCSSEKGKPATGQELYEYYCAGCHGESGAGQFLRAIPPLTQNKMLRKTPLQPSQIRHKIQGSPGPKRKMPSFANISDDEARLIALYIQKLSR